MLPLFKALDTSSIMRYGYFIIQNEEAYLINDNKKYKINRNTLCQHTGLEYSSEDKVYTHDIVDLSFNYSGIDFNIIGEVKEDRLNGRLVVVNKDQRVALVDNNYSNYSIKVISNKYSGVIK